MAITGERKFINAAVNHFDSIAKRPNARTRSSRRTALLVPVYATVSGQIENLTIVLHLDFYAWAAPKAPKFYSSANGLRR